MQCDILHADETFIKLMIKGTKKCKQAYLWYRLTGVGPPMIAFHFSPSLSRNVAESLLGNYSGTIIRDSYAAYEKLDCEVACCWAHVRRRFPQGVESGYTKAEPPLKIIHALYQIERVAKERAEKKGTETALYQERKNARRQSQKFIREFFEQCRVLNESEQPTSLVAQAVSYALNIEEKLKKFLKDSRLNINNNPAERLNRGIAIIRKKCLFAGSEAGRQRLAILYSFAFTRWCKLMKEQQSVRNKCVQKFGHYPIRTSLIASGVADCIRFFIHITSDYNNCISYSVCSIKFSMDI